MRAKFGGLEQTQGLHLYAKFHLNVFIVSASGGQKLYNFGQILTFSGLLYRRPFTEEGQIWCAIADIWSTLTCQISSRSVYSVVLWWRKKNNFCLFCRFLPFIGLRHLVLSPIGNSLTKLNTGAQLQTLFVSVLQKNLEYRNDFDAVG